MYFQLIVTCNCNFTFFRLPVTVKMQASKGIVDNRDPRVFMEVHQDLLEKSRMLRENGSLDRVEEED